MGIERRVLYNNRLGHTNAERRKIPNSLNSSRHHFIGHGLSYFNGYGKHTYINIIFKHLLFKFIGMINRNTAQCCPH